MKVSLNLNFEQLIQIIQSLPEDKKALLKSTLTEEGIVDTRKSKAEFKKFLLEAPVMSDKEYEKFIDNRRHFNQWRRI